ncbi:MAG: hypothetical protein U9Q71_02920, partial [Pseudomonadota bacterium]|nr:hypothetical protein [Pseudomonadota bacterium]
SLPTGDRYPPLELTPTELRQQTLQMLADRAQGISLTTPLLVQIEDLHWIDPTSLEMLHILVQGARGHAIFVLATARPEFTADFINLPHVSTLVINRLPEEYTKDLVEQTWVSFSLPKGILQEIVARSEGIPLFAEELSKTVIDQLRQGAEPSAGGLGVPATLQDSLLARLDYLTDSARAAAQVASAIGREFSPEVLAAVIGAGREKMRRRIDELLRAEVVYRSITSPQEVLIFKHALMQDAAYESLLQSDRREIHRRIAEAVEEQFPAIAEANPGVLARHWDEAGEVEKALPYCLTAGRWAGERFANAEAASHLNRGLKLLEKLPEGENRGQRELELRVALGTVLRISEGAGAKITHANYDRLVELCERLPESPEQFAALWGKWQNAMNFKRELGLEWTDRLQALAEKLDDPGLMVQAHHARWTTLFHVGRFAEAYEHIKKGLAYYDEETRRHHAALYGGHDARVCGGGFAAHTLWMLGYPDRSLEYAKKNRVWGDKLNHAGSSLHVAELNLLLYQFRREPEQLAPWIEKLEQICAENDLPEYEGKLSFNRGWLLASRGDAGAGIDLMREGLENQRALGSWEDVPMFAERLAKALGEDGRVENGLDYLEEALEVAENYSLRYWLAEVHRRKGELLRGAGREELAGKSFEEAMEVARKQKAKSLELRAAMSMARWCAEKTKPAEGLRILQPVYDWFTEGLDTPDLKAARALLQELGSA